MKKLLPVILILIVLSCGCGAQKLNKDKTKQMLVRNFYQVYEQYNVVGSGIYIVGCANKYGLVNSFTGDIYLDLLYDRMEKIDSDNILAAKDGEYTIVSSKGQQKVNLGNFGNVRMYNNGEQLRFLTYKDNYYTLMNINAEVITDFGQFDDLLLNTSTFDRFVTRRDNLYTVINETGNQIFNLGRFDDLVPVFNNNSYIVTRNNKKGVINEAGNLIVHITHENIWNAVKNSYYIINDNDKFGVANVDGKMVIPVKYDGVEAYQKAFVVSKDGYSGIMSLNGEILADFLYTQPRVSESDENTFKCQMKKDNITIDFLYDENGFNIVD